jgi:putative addiction module component (TIGR02574 family)
MTPALHEFEKLSVAERLQLVEDLWDSIARSQAELPVTQWQKEELARRKKAFLRRPDSGVTWEQAKQSILHSK